MGSAKDPPPSADFAAAAIRSLSGEQLYDSLQAATGRTLVQADLDVAERLLDRRQFIDAFQTIRLEKPRRSVVQSLALMNGAMTEKLVDPNSRFPSPEEGESLAKSVAEARDGGERRAALSDIVWAMLNSVEFSTIH